MQNQNSLSILNPIEQTTKMPSSKDSYGFVSSKDILEVFQSKGWTIDKTQVASARSKERLGFQKHIVWLKNENFGAIEGLSKDNESIPRLCLVNSHDSSSSLMVFFGLLRVACLNQIATGNVFRHFRAVHSKNVLNRLGQGIEYVTEGLPEVIENIQKLQSIQLTQSQRLEYAKAMVNLRLQNVKNVIHVDFTQVENAVREQDTANDAYTVLNRVQEYVIRGGIEYTYQKTLVDKNTGIILGTQNVNTRTRGVASIPTQLKLNTALVQNILKIAA